MPARSECTVSAGLAACWAMTLGAAVAAQPPASSSPQAPGRAVAFATTPRVVVDAMLDLAQVSGDDVVYDLGCGDGRIVVAAARRGARGVGIDIDPRRIAEAEARARREGVSDRVTLLVGDLFEADVREATVVMLYLQPRPNLRLRPRLLAELEPGTRVVSHSYDMGGWKPDIVRHVAGRRIYLWTVPGAH